MYESPFRIGKLLGELANLDPGRRICLGRELTKIHEQVVVGTAAELAALVGIQGEGSIPEKGEFALLVDGRSSEP